MEQADIHSLNFAFLSEYDTRLDRLGLLAERYFAADPSTSLIKLRQFAERLAQQTCARTGLLTTPEESQLELLRRLRFERAAPAEALNLFHHLRIVGNRATHDDRGDHREALNALKIARQLAIWFHRAFGDDPQFGPGPFVPPRTPEDAETALAKELEQLREERAHLLDAAERAREEAEAARLAHETAEARARRLAEEQHQWAALAEEEEEQKNAALAELTRLQAVAAQATPDQKARQRHRVQQASQLIELDEAATRTLIDEQLRARGWEADTKTLRHSKGARPIKGKAMAIAEWPTESGPADYALFIGLRCLATIEAKRASKNIPNAIEQAQRYARDIRLHDGGAEPCGGPWGEYRVPFVFATNARPYLKQIETQSGIWFRDTRKATHLSRALTDWPTPNGLAARLEIDVEAAQQTLAAQPMNFGFPLRDYQQRAIQAIERELANGQRSVLVAMATGTGKTKLAIALLYRLLNAKRFRRVCFVVDRSALGQQTGAEFSSTKVIGTKTFADIFDLKGLETTVPEPETKVHICTIQGLVRRVLYNDDPATVPPIDQYDLIVIDECHRGYLLDRELSDGELNFRSEADYVSKYRRVLEHFDAVKIGLTATPALHTVEIFGDPVFTYSYREAVVDGYLIDHEPPLRIVTELAQNGIHFARGEQVRLLDPKTGQTDLAHMPDDIDFEVESFNRSVITPEFNRAVAEELARHIDPALPGKTLVFAVTDAHADLLVDQLKQAFAKHYGEIEDAAIRKITGSVDKVGALIRSYRNDDLPKIAVTVDLLTTGIDVPKIINLVFLRRVNSRILYEQMLGRATRRCDDIGKEAFRIFDAVDLYPHLQGLTDMRPVVVNPSISFAQLFEELGGVAEEAHRAEIRDQLVVKLRRRLSRLPHEVREQYEANAGESIKDTLARLAQQPTAETAAWIRSKPGLGAILDWNPQGGTPLQIPISEHTDRVMEVSRGYGGADKPKDFLDGFTNFVRSNLNTMTALKVVVQRPRELTRAQLRELRLELDRLGYTDANLRRAWQDAKNEEIAASIVGFVRQAALGDALIPFEERVRRAMQRILAKHPWTDPQRKWLKRIAEQVEREIVVDREALDREPFLAQGGFRRLDNVFGGQIEAVLTDIKEELWRETA
ncbi:type I restriction-modification system endonuclease [Marichromatium bheemlicum]|uniref:Type I restriction-modification system endonuclease n=1 Tax=Marichromatium bheemlicum TaxID=365339 RepID=A0ABX1I9P0_9GAMM|nr:type I restriction-modification system endonuclease [Marichromatium bheemlicum]NKN34267.1 type I restriction-modification system endonuclease [Marichromatium bheemlicum]